MATAILQTAWNCRWSRAGHRITGLAEAVQPESLWVCVRDGARHSVGDEACAHCARWEPLATAVAPPTVFASSHSVLAASAASVAVAPRVTAEAMVQAAFRGTLVLIAFVFFAIGFVVLTSPLAVPFTIALWLCGAIPLAFAFGRFPARTDSGL
jgi:hypothetical protein